MATIAPEIETGFRRDQPTAAASDAGSTVHSNPVYPPEIGPANSEVERISRVQHNYYAVLKVDKDSPETDVRTSYYKLSRLVHPDKCRHEQASSASAAVNLAYDTLRNPAKKKLYDSYMEDKGEAEDGAGMTYAEWEAKQAHIQLPRWLESLLRIRGCGFCLLICLAPVLLLVGLLALVLYVFCLPVKILLACCWPSMQAKSEEAAPAGPVPPGPDGSRQAPLETVVIVEPPRTPTRNGIAWAAGGAPETPPSGVFSDGHQRFQGWPYAVKEVVHSDRDRSEAVLLSRVCHHELTRSPVLLPANVHGWRTV
ncbi:hypothetical protein WJX84_000449 [Apatococcus fuscideae]|uniref:J domain-containing protein n=1 Tax=Apatococcus fuscideae TaxID=2026836 RepID=A0AAW1SYC5_9CHLO